MRLTLHRGGCRPDPSGDKGVHKFTYSLLVHEAAFGTEAVIKPAYLLNYPLLAFGGNAKCNYSGSLLSAGADNIIIETVKPAEDKNGFIVRIYEAEGSYTACDLTLNPSIKSAFKTDMLEFDDEPLGVKNNSVKLYFKPYEIKTLRLK
ncbi:MAG: hypothetical protein J5852_09650 [Clostridia bacterium]|nr:hypothetical protein [Clostridia bacterium]